MTSAELKEYTSRAVELETAIYTQRKLMKEHERLLQKKRPIKPVMSQVQKPSEPKEPELMTATKTQNVILVSMSLFAISFCLMVLGIIGIIAGILVFAFACFGIYSTKDEKKTIEKINKQRMDDYHAQCEAYKEQKAKYDRDIVMIKKSYNDACDAYAIEVVQYDNDTNLAMCQHNNALTALQEALSDLYNENVVYAKYRNLVAITTINEYLQSGRCTELEGHEGAYNLYEMELRQNIVINQLSNIVSNLEQIKDNQFALYQELAHANATVDSIMREIRQVNENTRLTAYFSGISAIIDATPKRYITRGYIH